MPATPQTTPDNPGPTVLLRCCSTLGCPDESLEGAVDLACRHGLGAIEVRALGGTLDLPRYFFERFGNPAEFTVRGSSPALPMVALNASLRLAAATAEDREQLLALAPWADALSAPRIRVFDGGNTADEHELAQARATVEWWREERRRRDWRVDLCVETHDSLVTTPAILRFVRAVPGVPVLWDAHHTWRRGGEEPLLTWQAIRRHVVHVHVKDSINVPSARHPHTYVLPGEGDFPIAPLLAALRADGFSGPVSLEWEKLWHPYLPSLDAALSHAKARGWW
ncbi:MAG: TIM barrel protein [Opitutaceae bacterium]|nr:TIM barrel protein [Opitutaceae bacterium]